MSVKRILTVLQNKRHWAACLISLFILSGCQTVDKTLSMADARNSYRQGDHERAFRLSEALAHEGDREAQYAVGYMYFHGIGAPKDQQLGILWIQKSAKKGLPTAIKAINALEQYPQTHLHAPG